MHPFSTVIFLKQVENWRFKIFFGENPGEAKKKLDIDQKYCNLQALNKICFDSVYISTLFKLFRYFFKSLFFISIIFQYIIGIL